MSLIDNRPTHRRPPLEIFTDQLAGIDAWNAVRRVNQAMIERTEQQIRDTARLLRRSHPRAVIVHRNDWFKDKLTAGLTAGGVDVVERLENGADAIGVVVAEQPDLVLVEDKLPMIMGDEVIRQVLRFAPNTIAAAQVGNDWEIEALLEAGARTAFARRVPPADVAADLCQLVGA